jgi:hypothetical protein
MNYPLDLTFKILALSGQIYVRDAGGALVAFVRQKFLKLKEDINIFGDEQQTRLLYNVKADRIIDWSARYTFTDAQGQAFGALKRHGARSIWRANYDIFATSDTPVMHISELSGWVRVADSLFGELPLIGILSGYLFHPTFIVYRGDAPVAKLEKKPAFFEGKFQLSEVKDLSEAEERLVFVSVLTMTILERSRG